MLRRALERPGQPALEKLDTKGYPAITAGVQDREGANQEVPYLIHRFS